MHWNPTLLPKAWRPERYLRRNRSIMGVVEDGVTFIPS